MSSHPSRTKERISHAFATLVLGLCAFLLAPESGAHSQIKIRVFPAHSVVEENGGTQKFTAEIRDNSGDGTVTWALIGAGCVGNACGTLSVTSSHSGVAITYRAPGAVPSPPTVTLLATSAVDPSAKASAAITIAPNAGPVSVTISPMRGGLAARQSLSVTARVTNDVGSAGVTWTASGKDCHRDFCGKFTNVTNNSASYRVPSEPGVYTITATSVVDSGANASATIGVTDLEGVTTYHNGLSRDGTNTREFALSTSLVNTATFGKLFSCQADAPIYTQPLWIPQRMFQGALRNVIVVATQNDSVYAFDADANPCITLWHANLLDSAHGATAGETSVPTALVGRGYGNISPTIGVTGTPVIDPITNAVYVVSKSVNSDTQFFQRLHALDLATGNERVPPQEIGESITVPGTGDASVNGVVAFDPQTELQRSALALYDGVVYVCWASHEDKDPYHGWVIGFSASTLAPIGNRIFNTTPNSVGTPAYSRGGIWMSGGAPAVDSRGFLYFIVANGTFDANAAGGANYGDSLMKMNTAGGLSVADYFTPSDEAFLDAGDADFGSGAATILIDPSGGPNRHLVIGGGKEGNLFLVNRDDMGKFNSASNNVIQTINAGGAIFATPVFWRDNLYIAAGTLQQFTLNPETGMFGGSAVSQTTAIYGYPGATASLSSNGDAEGILWASDSSQYCTPQSNGCGPAVLHAYDATNLAIELWNSSQADGNRDQAGDAVKFTVPTIANGKVYLGTRGNNTTVMGELDAYGLLPN